MSPDPFPCGSVNETNKFVERLGEGYSVWLSCIAKAKGYKVIGELNKAEHMLESKYISTCIVHQLVVIYM